MAEVHKSKETRRTHSRAKAPLSGRQMRRLYRIPLIVAEWLQVCSAMFTPISCLFKLPYTYATQDSWPCQAAARGLRRSSRSRSAPREQPSVHCGNSNTTPIMDCSQVTAAYQHTVPVLSDSSSVWSKKKSSSLCGMRRKTVHSRIPRWVLRYTSALSVPVRKRKRRGDHPAAERLKVKKQRNSRTF